MWRHHLLTTARFFRAPETGDGAGSDGGEGDGAGDGDGKGADFDAGKASKAGSLMDGLADDEDDSGEGEGEGDSDAGEPDADGDKDKEPPAPYKPEGLEDRFLGKDDKETIEKIFKAYQGARKELSKGPGKPPESADAYKLEAGKDADDETKAVIESLSTEENKPVFDAFKTMAFERGLSQSQFEGLVTDFMKFGNSHFGGESFDPGREMEVLGGEEKAKPVMQAVHNWGRALQQNNILTAEEREEFNIMAGTGMGVKVMNKLRELAGERQIPTYSDPESPKTKEEVYAMTSDPRYGVDPKFTKEAEKAFEEVFGTEPAMASQSGLGVR